MNKDDINQQEMTKRRPGRPEKRPGERLSKTIFVRVTFKELMALKGKAREGGLDLPDFLRSIIRREISRK